MIVIGMKVMCCISSLVVGIVPLKLELIIIFRNKAVLVLYPILLLMPILLKVDRFWLKEVLYLSDKMELLTR